MSFTIDLDDAAVAEAKKFAQEDGTSVEAMVKEAFQKALRAKRLERRRKAVELIHGSLKGLVIPEGKTYKDLIDEARVEKYEL